MVLCYVFTPVPPNVPEIEGVQLCHCIESIRFEDSPVVEFMYLLFTRTHGETYSGRFRSLSSCPLLHEWHQPSGFNSQCRQMIVQTFTHGGSILPVVGLYERRWWPLFLLLEIAAGKSSNPGSRQPGSYPRHAKHIQQLGAR